MKRTINIKLRFSIVIDDKFDGLPFIHNPNELILNGAKTIQGLTEIKPGALLEMAIDRASWNEIRRRDRVRRANAR
jgi:hypothetical protein